MGKALTVLTVLIFMGPYAQAEFGDIHNIPISSAATLEQGALVIGIFSPVGYGVRDDLTLFFHPVMELLLTPNVTLRWRAVMKEDWILSFQLGYLQSLSDTTKEYLPAHGHFIGIFTWFPSNRLSLTLQAGYVGSISPTRHGATFGGAVSFLFTPSDLLTASVSEEWYHASHFSVPYGLLVYTHAFETMRVSAGMAFSKIPITVGEADIRFSPVFPVLDLWWQL